MFFESLLSTAPDRMYPKITHSAIYALTQLARLPDCSYFTVNKTKGHDDSTTFSYNHLLADAH
jgi:hypothetical protein